MDSMWVYELPHLQYQKSLMDRAVLGGDCQPQVSTTGSGPAVLTTSAKPFPPLFTDHSVASILASDTEVRQPERVLLTNLAPSGEQGQQRDDSTANAVDFLYQAFNRTASFTCFDDAEISSHQLASSALSVVDYVDEMVTACHNFVGIDELQSPSRETSHSSLQQDRLLGDDGGRGGTNPTEGGVVRPTPVYPRRPPTLPPADWQWQPRLELESAELWREFDERVTEMVITKSGRRMFPALKFKVTGLEPDSKYIFLLDIVPVNNYRYKFQQSRWVISGQADDNEMSTLFHHKCVYVHPDSPATGSHWMAKSLSFHRLKLTNNVTDINHGQAVLNSMHYYQPRIHLLHAQEQFDSGVSPSSVLTFAFPQTRFVAVTAYQNSKITQLKIDHNPFAKGFRVCGSAKKADKRELSSIQNSTLEMLDVTDDRHTESLSCDFRFVML